uniref:Large ribosomal subunit protein uL22c n=1 Tax=Palmophyllum crassum TaxID=1615899 RepID=A0A1L7NXW5_9VIRI|nr:ribosomal protein L22 [Palmophyllum crassum]BAW34756.1 ribosomal protein L22 [Palmophyllum crassum]
MLSEVKANSKNIRISPDKVRRILNQIRGKSYEESILILKFLPYKACTPVFKVLYSAASNAKHNYGWTKSQLIIKDAYADNGSTLKRFRPRAQGRGCPIKKRTCKIAISVILSSNFIKK